MNRIVSFRYVASQTLQARVEVYYLIMSSIPLDNSPEEPFPFVERIASIFLLNEERVGRHVFDPSFFERVAETDEAAEANRRAMTARMQYIGRDIPTPVCNVNDGSLDVDAIKLLHQSGSPNGLFAKPTSPETTMLAVNWLPTLQPKSTLPTSREFDAVSVARSYLGEIKGLQSFDALAFQKDSFQDEKKDPLGYLRGYQEKEDKRRGSFGEEKKDDDSASLPSQCAMLPVSNFQQQAIFPVSGPPVHPSDEEKQEECGFLSVSSAVSGVSQGDAISVRSGVAKLDGKTREAIGQLRSLIRLKGAAAPRGKIRRRLRFSDTDTTTSVISTSSKSRTGILKKSSIAVKSVESLASSSRYSKTTRGRSPKRVHIEETETKVAEGKMLEFQNNDRAEELKSLNLGTELVLVQEDSGAEAGLSIAPNSVVADLGVGAILAPRAGTATLDPIITPNRSTDSIETGEISDYSANRSQEPRKKTTHLLTGTHDKLTRTFSTDFSLSVPKHIVTHESKKPSGTKKLPEQPVDDAVSVDHVERMQLIQAAKNEASRVMTSEDRPFSAESDYARDVESPVTPLDRLDSRLCFNTFKMDNDEDQYELDSKFCMLFGPSKVNARRSRRHRSRGRPRTFEV